MNVHDNLEFKRLAERVTALEAKVMAGSPIYREPTLEDASDLLSVTWALRAEEFLIALKKKGFYRKVQP